MYNNEQITSKMKVVTSVAVGDKRKVLEDWILKLNVNFTTLLKKVIKEIFPTKIKKNVHERAIYNGIRLPEGIIFQRLLDTIKEQYFASPFHTILKLKTHIKEIKDNFDFSNALETNEAFKELVENESNENLISSYLNSINFLNNVVNGIKSEKTVDQIIKNILTTKFANEFKKIPILQNNKFKIKLEKFLNFQDSFEKENKFNLASPIAKALNYNENNVDSFFASSAEDFEQKISDFISTEFRKNNNIFIKEMYEFLAQQAKEELEPIMQHSVEKVGDLLLAQDDASRFIEDFLPSYKDIIIKYGLNQEAARVSINYNVKLTSSWKGKLNDLHVKYVYDNFNQWDLISKQTHSIDLEEKLSTINKALNIVNDAFIKVQENELFPKVITEAEFEKLKIPQKDLSKFDGFVNKNGELELTLDHFNTLFKKKILIDFSTLPSPSNFQEIIKIKLTHKKEIEYQLGVKQLDLEESSKEENPKFKVTWFNTKTIFRSYDEMLLNIFEKAKFTNLKNNWIDEFVDGSTGLYTRVYNDEFIKNRTNFLNLSNEFKNLFTATKMQDYKIEPIVKTINNNTILEIQITHTKPGSGVEKVVGLITKTLKNSDMVTGNSIEVGDLQRKSDIKKIINKYLKFLNPISPTFANGNQPKPQIGNVVLDTYKFMLNNETITLKKLKDTIQSELNVNFSWSTWSKNTSQEEGIEFKITTIPKKLHKVSDGSYFSIQHSHFFIYKLATQKHKNDAFNEIKDKLKNAKNIDSKEKDKIRENFKNITKGIISLKKLDKIKKQVLLKIDELNNNVELLQKLNKFYKGKIPQSILDLAKKYPKTIENILNNTDLTDEGKKALLTHTILSKLSKLNSLTSTKLFKTLSKIKTNSKYTYFALGVGLGIVGLTGIVGGGAMITTNKRMKILKSHIKFKKTIIFSITITSIVAIVSSVATLFTFFVNKGGI